MASKKTVLITGCSKGGLGDALARAFHTKGFRVFATGRNSRKIEHFGPLGIETVILDVLSQESIRKCVVEIENRTGGTLDILVNNSGAGYSMPLADASLDVSRDLFNLNVWSVLEVVQAFLPLLLKSGSGAMIANNTSIASVVGVPMQGIYNASKAAAASITDTLRLELQPFGVRVVDLRTGAVKSEFFANMANGKAPQPMLPENSIYAVARRDIEKVLRGEALQDRMADPDQWANKVVGDLTVKNPRSTIWRGGSAFLAWFGRAFFPHTFFDGMLKEIGGLKALEGQLSSVKH